MRLICKILKELKKFYDQQPQPYAWVALDGLPLWQNVSRQKDGYETLSVAVTQLLQEGLILGSSTAKDKTILRLNPQKLAEITSACAWDWKYLAMLLAAVLAAVAGFLALRLAPN